MALRPPFGRERGCFLSSVSSPWGVPRPLTLGETSETSPRDSAHRAAQTQVSIPEKEEAAPGARASCRVLSCVRGQGPPFSENNYPVHFIRTFSSTIRQRVASRFPTSQQRPRLPCVTREGCPEGPQRVLMPPPGRIRSSPAGASGHQVTHEDGYPFRSKGSKNSPRTPFS